MSLPSPNPSRIYPNLTCIPYRDICLDRSQAASPKPSKEQEHSKVEGKPAETPRRLGDGGKEMHIEGIGWVGGDGGVHEPDLELVRVPDTDRLNDPGRTAQQSAVDKAAVVAMVTWQLQWSVGLHAVEAPGFQLEAEHPENTQGCEDSQVKNVSGRGSCWVLATLATMSLRHALTSLPPVPPVPPLISLVACALVADTSLLSKGCRTCPPMRVSFSWMGK